jgi:hypothetical protein
LGSSLAAADSTWTFVAEGAGAAFQDTAGAAARHTIDAEVEVESTGSGTDTATAARTEAATELVARDA